MSSDSLPHYGLIAQEVEQTLGGKNHGIVHYNSDSDRYSVAYTELIAPIIKAVQVLYAQLLSVKGQ